jgi:hypothetical protein
VHRAGIASLLEPALCHLPGLEEGAGSSREGHSIRVGALEDNLLALGQVITVTDISVIHPLSINTLSAAVAEAGAAASCPDQQNRNAYVRAEPNGYAFVPFSVESYGCLGKPAMKLLHDLGDKASGLGGVTRASFVAGALRIEHWPDPGKLFNVSCLCWSAYLGDCAGIPYRDDCTHG